MHFKIETAELVHFLVDSDYMNLQEVRMGYRDLAELDCVHVHF